MTNLDKQRLKFGVMDFIAIASLLLVGFIPLYKLFIIIFGFARIKSLLLLNLFEFVNFIIFLTFLRKKKKILLDIFLLFLVFFFLYNNAYNLYYYFFGNFLLFLEFSYEQVLNTMSLSSLTLSCFILLHIFLNKIIGINSEFSISESIQSQLDTFKNKRIKFNHLIIFTLLIDLIALRYDLNFFKAGGLSILGSKSRHEAAQLVENISFLQKYLIISFTFFLFLLMKFKIKFSRKVYNYEKLLFFTIFLSPIFLFWIINLTIGNRRELVYLIILIFALFVSVSNLSFARLSKFLVFGFFALLFFLSYGFLRNTILSGSSYEVSFQRYILDSLGEFIGPYQTLVYYTNLDDYNFKFGGSYLFLTYFFIPRFLWLQKPVILPVQFIRDLNLGVGYAFTPLTECYVNFGMLSIIIFPAIVFIIFTLIFKLNKYLPFLFLFVFMQVVNFNRGLVITLVTETIDFYLVFYLAYRFILTKSKLAIE